VNSLARPSELPIELAKVDVMAGALKILDEISLNISSGPPTVLIGPNGSGKTTLLRVAMGLTSPSRGMIRWGTTQDSPRRGAMVLQHPVMLRRSVLDNLRFALKSVGVPRGAQPRRAEKLLARVGLDGLRDRPARRLSGGEQQRLALARALARDPEVLFLDEPTASLDPAATSSVEELVRSVSAQGIKIVMATHDLGEAHRLAGDIVFLHRGTILEQTTAKRFFVSPQSLEAQRFLAGELLL
jgi:tungstate transport system ATP-binding protein